MQNKIIDKKKILILADYYVPGIKGGGPIQSIKNIVDNLKSEFNFYIIAKDRDLGDREPYKNIQQDKWQIVGNANVYYVSEEKFNIFNITKIINEVNYDVLYLNSFFAIKTGLMPIILRKFKKIDNKKIVMAPRGQFSKGALQLKSLKKSLYIKTFKILNLHKDLIWQSTAEIESKDIKQVFGDDITVKLANNLTANYDELLYTKNIEKRSGSIKLVFLSRITPKKNLKKAINFLSKIKGNVIFDIYGPIEDKFYWNECKNEINKLGSNIEVNYRGSIQHNEINNMFNKYHIFLFPTLGENFGHVISEALIGGCPVILSDQTPWRKLEEKNVGWDIPLEDENKFIDIIQKCIDMNKEEYLNLSMDAFNYGKIQSNCKEDIEATKQLLNSAL